MNEVGASAEGLLLAFLRLIAFFVASPFPGPLVPPTVRVFLAGGLAWALTPAAIAAPSQGLIVAALSELALGLAAGFLLTLPLAAFTAAGELVGNQMGLSAPGLADPLRFHSSMVGSIYTILAIAVFAAGEGPARVTVFLARSLELLPPGSAPLLIPEPAWILSAGRELLEGGVQVAAPVVTAVFAAQVVLAVLARSVPTLNLFVEGPALTLSAGVLGLLASVHTFVPLVDRLFGARFEALAAWLVG